MGARVAVAGASGYAGGELLRLLAGHPDLEIGLFLGHPGSLAYGLRRDETELLAALNAYIDNNRHTPTWNRLVVKYFGENAPEVLRKARGD